MRVVVLHITDILSELARNRRRVVLWVHVAGDDAVLGLEEFLQPHHGLAQCLNSPHVLHVADIR